MPTLLDPTAAAERLNLSTVTLARWRMRGGGPAFVKLGARVMYPLDELEAWVARQLRTSTSDDGAPRRRRGRRVA